MLFIFFLPIQQLIIFVGEGKWFNINGWRALFWSQWEIWLGRKGSTGEEVENSGKHCSRPGGISQSVQTCSWPLELSKPREPFPTYTMFWLWNGNGAVTSYYLCATNSCLVSRGGNIPFWRRCQSWEFTLTMVKICPSFEVHQKQTTPKELGVLGPS